MIIAGTGHRPKYCPCKYKENHPWLTQLKENLTAYLTGVHEHTTVIIRAGGAIGWDTWLAEVAIDLNLPLHLYLPFEGQELAWPSNSRIKYKIIKAAATKVFYTADHYSSDVFLKRDVEMITGADLIVSLLDPEIKSGGTYYTVRKAKEMGIEVRNFWI